jgi:hypothetical protein
VPPSGRGRCLDQSNLRGAATGQHFAPVQHFVLRNDGQRGQRSAARSTAQGALVDTLLREFKINLGLVVPAGLVHGARKKRTKTDNFLYHGRYES